MLTDKKYLPFFDTVKTAWHLVSGAKLTILTLMILTMFTGLMFGLSQAVIKAEGWTILFAGLRVLGNVVVWLLALSFVHLGLQRAIKKDIRIFMIGKLFSLNLIFRLIGLFMLSALVMAPAFLIGLPFYYANFADVGQWVILLSLAYLFIRLFFALPVLLTSFYGPRSAVKMSFKATRGQEFPILGLLILFGTVLFLAVLPLITWQVVCQVFMLPELWYVLGCLPAAAGFIWAVSFIVIAYGEAYRRLITIV